ncbi:MAG TPA: hypothetical protein VGN97_11855 [Mesorhizobium sp.]|jgi:hypothetical protein|nr:hypothetical protein [Mesorhizobium sp.]
MARISFAFLDQDFHIDRAGFYAARQFSDERTAQRYSFQTSDNHDVDLEGSNFIYTADTPVGGVVRQLTWDLGNDDLAESPDIRVTDLNFFIYDLQVGAGSAYEQNNRFWNTVLKGSDLFDLTLADYGVDFSVAGDGADLAGGTAVGLGDRFIGGPQAMTGQSVLVGDFMDVLNSATAMGGDDVFSASLWRTIGDFRSVLLGGVGIGGDDRMAAPRLADNSQGAMYFFGDAEIAEGALIGGDDVIDLSGAATAGFSQTVFISGDAWLAYAAFIGGDDVLTGSGVRDYIYGDYGAAAASAIPKGGNDRISGGAGDDILFGNGGSDLIDGGADNDTAFFTDLNMAGYSAIRVGGALYVSQIVDGATDTLVNVEQVSFTGQFETVASIEAFDGLAYVASHADLVNAYRDLGSRTAINEAGARHFAFSGYFEGRLTEGEPLFDAQSYVNNYADLRTAFGSGATLDAQAATLHFIKNGSVEGRLGFDGLAYIAGYADLRSTFGSDPEAGAQHFRVYGRTEGREVRFDAQQYIDNYADLAGLSDTQAAQHFILSGASEGRTFIDPLDYVASYADLIQAFGDYGSAPNAANLGRDHYINIGRGEGRQATFDAWQYLENYDDLTAAFGRNVDAATQHFIQYGFYEGRTDDAVFA